jgi:hypothetical protein
MNNLTAATKEPCGPPAPMGGRPGKHGVSSKARATVRLVWPSSKVSRTAPRPELLRRLPRPDLLTPVLDIASASERIHEPDQAPPEQISGRSEPWRLWHSGTPRARGRSGMVLWTFPSVHRPSTGGRPLAPPVLTDASFSKELWSRRPDLNG